MPSSRGVVVQTTRECLCGGLWLSKRRVITLSQEVMTVAEPRDIFGNDTTKVVEVRV